MSKKVYGAELHGDTAQRWIKQPSVKRKTLLSLPFIKDIFKAKIWFTSSFEKADIDKKLETEIKRMIGVSDVTYLYSPTSVSDRVALYLNDRSRFEKLGFGSDIAEHDQNLMDYFITTDVFTKVQDRRKSIIVGPKGSGKSAILRAVHHHSNSEYVFSITPEVFSKSLLTHSSSAIDANNIDEDDFIVTWIYSIITEIFKTVCTNPRGISNPRMLRPIRDFLIDNTSSIDLDLFSRFLGYMKDIQSVKVAGTEVSVSKSQNSLQELYALERIYALLPILRQQLKDDIVILIDELDQGWDNSGESNGLLVGLLQAAIRLRSMDTKIHVVIFIRSEMFEIMKESISQLDKLRSEIGYIYWFHNELRNVISKRIAHSLNLPDVELSKIEASVVDHIFQGNFQGENLFDYIISRTTRRPREVLQFVRLAHEFAVDSGKGYIGIEEISEAEKTFSEWKIEHLNSEYLHIYPKVKKLIEYFVGFGPILSRSDIVGIFEEFENDNKDIVRDWWAESSDKDPIDILYTVEFIGYESFEKESSQKGMIENFYFSYDRRATRPKRAKSYIIHPAFWNYLELGIGLKA